MFLLRKINRIYFFYNYCYAVFWQRLWGKYSHQPEQTNGIFFTIISFLLYIFLLAVILWRCGVHARWSGPVMFWIDLTILVYGIYLGSRKDLQRSYFERFSVKNAKSGHLRGIIYIIFFSPFMAILLSLYLAKPFIVLHFP